MCVVAWWWRWAGHVTGLHAFRACCVASTQPAAQLADRHVLTPPPPPQVCEGLELGVAAMKAEERAIITVSDPALAVPPEGAVAGSGVPRGCGAVFDVTLKSFTKAKEKWEMNNAEKVRKRERVAVPQQRALKSQAAAVRARRRTTRWPPLPRPPCLPSAGGGAVPQGQGQRRVQGRPPGARGAAVQRGARGGGQHQRARPGAAPD